MNYKEVEEEKKPTPAIEFTGTMDQGMAIVMTMALFQIYVSQATVFVTREELIFPDRIATKFIVDIVRVFITLGFAMFWM